MVSDSHGAFSSICTAYEKENPEQVLYLGDGHRDIERFIEQHPNVPVHTVIGNCDGDTPGELEKLVEFGSKRILMMHGHSRSCRFSNMNVIMAARECGADVVLYGHTHQPLVDFDGSLFVMNPGTCNPRGSCTYGIITIDAKGINCFTRKVKD